MNIKVKKFEFNPFPVNTYVVYDDTKECLIIDAGMFYDKEKEILQSFISSNDLVVKHLINTHLHFDHILGNPFIHEKYGLRTKAHEGDLFLLNRVKDQAKMFGFTITDDDFEMQECIDENNTIAFGNSELKILHVPGHSPGSLVFYSQPENILFSGDVLFDGSIGRTDLPGGDYDKLIEGINTKLLTLPDEVIVYSGHGPETTIGKEKRTNPFLT